MGLLSAFRRNTGPAPDPNPGEGGYTAPRGPMGQTGYPGSTKQVRTNPAEAGGRLHDDYAGAHTGYGTDPNAANRSAIVEGSYSPAGSPPPRSRRGQGRGWVAPEGQQAELQREASEWFGGPNRHVGTSNLGQHEKPGDALWTERQQTLGYGSRGLGAGVPGDQPGRPHARQFFKGAAARPDGDNRFVFGGPNGGQTSHTFDRRMPLTSRGNGARGADLNAERYYASPADYFGDQGGQYGYARSAPDGQHRPTEYYEPGPWTANFYDTTEQAGSPAESGAAPQAYDAVAYSPATRGRRRG